MELCISVSIALKLSTETIAADQKKEGGTIVWWWSYVRSCATMDSMSSSPTTERLDLVGGLSVYDDTLQYAQGRV